MTDTLDTDPLFPIEWFFRVKAGYQAVLDLDALLIRTDLPPLEHAERVTHLIETTVASVSTGA